MAGDLFRFFLPGTCAGCGDLLPPAREEPVCVSCVLALRPPPPPLCPRCGLPRGSGPTERDGCEECTGWPPVLARARSAVLLEPPADRLVHGLKYEGWRSLARVMAERMVGVLEVLPDPAPELVVPVPTTRTRRRRRGYNQAAVLAGELGIRLQRPTMEALRRRPGSRTQVALQPSQRGPNVRRAFTARAERRERIRGRRVLLVDDVLTTGATACAAARVLEGAGVTEVTLLTFARAAPFRDRARSPGA